MISSSMKDWGCACAERQANRREDIVLRFDRSIQVWQHHTRSRKPAQHGQGGSSGFALWCEIQITGKHRPTSPARIGHLVTNRSWYLNIFSLCLWFAVRIRAKFLVAKRVQKLAYGIVRLRFGMLEDQSANPNRPRYTIGTPKAYFDRACQNYGYIVFQLRSRKEESRLVLTANPTHPVTAERVVRLILENKKRDH